MGFTNQERINANTNALQANVLDANPSSQWYEKLFPFEFALPNTKIFTQLGSVPSADGLYVAKANAIANPTVISDVSSNINAVRLTTVFGTNDFTWVAYNVYNDRSSPRLDNWIQPQLISQSNGNPSTGYGIAFYNGQPVGATGSLEVTNFANLVDGVSTITVQDYLGNNQVFTAVSSGATGLQFNIGADNDETATNIANSINNFGGFTAQVNGVTPNQVDLTQAIGGTQGNTRTITTNQSNAIGNLVDFSGGTGDLITTTAGQTGSGVNASVGWIWNYTLGMLLLSQDFFTQTGITKATFDPYVNGFRYIGEFAGSGSGSATNVKTDNIQADETIATGDIVRLVQFGESGNIGRLVKSNANDSQSEESYIALNNGNAGDNIECAIVGDINVNFSSIPTSNDNGKRCFLNTTSGQATLTAPTSSGSLVILLGTLVGADGITSSPRVIFRPKLLITNA